MDKICCVYKLTNTQTGKFYIGSTFNFYSRMKYHRYSHSKNPNKVLGADIEKYGWDSFKAEILERCTRENVRERERFYIDSLHAVEEGYNITHATNYSEFLTGYNNRSWRDPEYRRRHSVISSEIQKKRLQNPKYLAEKSAQLKRYTDSIKKPVGMFSKDGALLHSFDGVRAAERWLIENGVTESRNASSAISDCANGGRHKTVYGYVWRYL